MADQLTSVRFDGETLKILRLLADIHETSVAEEIRTAVRRYVESLGNDASFRAQADASLRRRKEQVEELIKSK
jgi:hypothetical protein